MNGVQVVGGSNPLTPTSYSDCTIRQIVEPKAYITIEWIVILY